MRNDDAASGSLGLASNPSYCQKWHFWHSSIRYLQYHPVLTENRGRVRLLSGRSRSASGNEPYVRCLRRSQFFGPLTVYLPRATDMINPWSWHHGAVTRAARFVRPTVTRFRLLLASVCPVSARIKSSPCLPADKRSMNGFGDAILKTHGLGCSPCR